MKSIEKYLLLALVSSFLLVLTPIPFLKFLFYIMLLCVIGLYIFKSHKLFYSKKEHIYLLMSVGFFLGISLFSIFFYTSFSNTDAYLIFILLNSCILFFFAIYFLIKRKNFPIGYKQITIRVFSVFILNILFFNLSHHYSLNRWIIKQFNEDNLSILSNIEMWDSAAKYDIHFENKDYDLAIEEAKITLQKGKEWVYYSISPLETISGAYTNLYDAYKYKGDQLYDDKQYTEALISYKKADSIIYLTDYQPPEGNKNRQYNSHWSLLDTYDKLDSISKFQVHLDSLFLHHLKPIDTTHTDLYSLLQTGTSFYLRQQYYADAIELGKANLIFLERDTINSKDTINHRLRYVNTYANLLINYYQFDSISQTENILSKFEKIATPEHCIFFLVKTQYLLKASSYEAISYAKKACDCYGKLSQESSNYVYSQLLLAESYLSSSKLREVKKKLDQIHNLIFTSALKNNINLISRFYKLRFDYYFTIQDYTKAKQNIQLIFDLKSDTFNDTYLKLQLALIDTEIEISFDLNLLNKKLRKKFNDATFLSTAEISIYNDWASINVQYPQHRRFADSLFKQTLEVHKKANVTTTHSLSIAYNGLGVVNFYNKKYTIADSLFTKSLSIIEEEKHISKAVTIYNLALSSFQQKKYIAFESYIDRYESIIEKYFPSHTNMYHAQLYKLRGDLLKYHLKDIKTANTYYKKALDIAQKYFSDHHSFIIELKTLLKLS